MRQDYRTGKNEAPSLRRTRQAQGESSRLAKAKVLLDQFTNDPDDFLDERQTLASSNGKVVNGETTSVSVATTNGSVSPSPQRNGVSKNKLPTPSRQNKKVENRESVELATVPDTFWNNGHLMENGMAGKDGRGGYVTRWARGVKVAEPLVKYDPIAAEKLLFRQPTKWLVRNFQIALPIGWWAAGVVSDYLSGQSKPNRRQRAAQLRRAISELGPAIIKGGQALASRPDLLPSEYLEELQKLQDDGTSVSLCISEDNYFTSGRSFFPFITYHCVQLA